MRACWRHGPQTPPEAVAAVEQALRPASEEWLTGRVKTLLAQWFVPDDAPAVRRAVIRDWCRAVGKFGQGAIERGCDRFLAERGPKPRPVPAELVVYVKAEQAELGGALRQAKREPPPPPPPLAPVDRRRQVVEEIMLELAARGSSIRLGEGRQRRDRPPPRLVWCRMSDADILGVLEARRRVASSLGLEALGPVPGPRAVKVFRCRWGVWL